MEIHEPGSYYRMLGKAEEIRSAPATPGKWCT
jgi:hypothetical protein